MDSVISHDYRSSKQYERENKQKTVKNRTATESTRSAPTKESEINVNPLETEQISPTSQHDWTEVFESKEHLSLPTVFEGEITGKRRKSSKGKQLPNSAHIRKSRSNNDVREKDPGTQSLSRQLIGSRLRQRKISSPLPANGNTQSLDLDSVRRRALSESPAEVLISPVIPRRSFSPENFFSPKQTRRGMVRVSSCPVMKDTEEQGQKSMFILEPNSPRPKQEEPATGLQRRNVSISLRTVSVPFDGSNSGTSGQNKLPQINVNPLSPILVRSPPKTPSKASRELFNVSPVMGQSANSKEKTNNYECDFTDKVEYFLYTMSVTSDEEEIL